MILKIIGHNFRYEMECLCRIFFPAEKIIVVNADNCERQSNNVTTELIKAINKTEIIVRAELDDKSQICIRTLNRIDDDSSSEIEREMAIALFYALSRITEYSPPWGILTGVRPAKLMLNLLKNLDEKQAVEYFKTKLLVSEEKTILALSVAKSERTLMKKVDSNYFSLYIAIPFCPSRCSYCSFVSHSISGSKAKKMVPVYIEHLCEEIKVIGLIASELCLKPQTIYFGGGTPTSLDEHDLERLLSKVASSFNLSALNEFTVEAGRPDTVSAEKLLMLRKYEISRISINPQSFNDYVLEKAERKHSSKCAIDAFRLARNIGFDNINMDLIAGLPEDNLISFNRTLDITLDLAPENITIHTLALKRASNLSVNGCSIVKGNHIAEMLNSAGEKLTRFSYEPYYMYRQSLSAGNHENIGWSKSGFEGLYNVIMMEECQTVLSAGAGGVSKLMQSGSNRLERIFNFKYPYEYNSRFNEIIERKAKIIDYFKQV